MYTPFGVVANPKRGCRGGGFPSRGHRVTMVAGHLPGRPEAQSKMDELSGYIVSQVRLEQYAMLSHIYHKIENHIYIGAANGTYKKMHQKPAFSTVMKFAVDHMEAVLVKDKFERAIICIEFPYNSTIGDM